MAISSYGLPEVVEALPLTQVEPTGITRGRTADEEGPKERFLPRSSTLRIVLMAEESARPTANPRVVRIMARPIVGGKEANPFLVRTIPLMILRRSETEQFVRAENRSIRERDGLGVK